MDPAKLIGGHVQLLPEYLLDECDIYCHESGLLTRDLSMKSNCLTNPIVSEEWLIRMATYGGPFGNLVVVREDGKPIPFDKIREMYKEYDDNDEEYDYDEWYEGKNKALNKAIRKFQREQQYKRTSKHSSQYKQWALSALSPDSWLDSPPRHDEMYMLYCDENSGLYGKNASTESEPKWYFRDISVGDATVVFLLNFSYYEDDDGRVCVFENCDSYYHPI